ncbi:hypothetical protein F6J84_12240 [Microbacterium caowuchunii]|uniref:hypothetical protein n=1 Tax=Microbacterium caowuchunii TaxID=2614638 RepID=UPI001246AB79|nr:hypothetical protein [Microbacterium caowuchunii]QEW00794.1 hypothetical protein F6J84_12240 [Microbacterium caowuchunii]
MTEPQPQPQPQPDPDAEARPPAVRRSPMPAAQAQPVAGPASPAADPTGPPQIRPHLEPASSDVAAPTPEASLPGAHRGGFTRPPTAPIGITIEQIEFVPVTGAVATPPPLRPANFAATALGFAIVALIASMVVGVAFPIGVTAIVLGALSMRRAFESRAVARWAIVLGVVSVLYSAGWLLWAAYRSGWFA